MPKCAQRLCLVISGTRSLTEMQPPVLRKMPPIFQYVHIKSFIEHALCCSGAIVHFNPLLSRRCSLPPKDLSEVFESAQVVDIVDIAGVPHASP